MLKRNIRPMGLVRNIVRKGAKWNFFARPGCLPAVGFACVLLAGFPSPVMAETLDKLIVKMMETHERIKAAEFEVKSVRQNINKARANYLPSVDVTGDYGYQKQNKPTGSVTTSTMFREGSLTVNQLLWDFGKTLSQMDRAKLQVLKAEYQLENVRQGLIREAAAAYLNLLRAFDTLRYARQSEENIKRQTGLEEALVERQSGLETDVLQAKTSLAGASSLRVQAEGALVNAVNRYKAVFNQDIGDLKTYKRPSVRLDLLPKNVDEALEMALRSNLTLRASFVEADIAKKTAERDRLDIISPEIKIVGKLDHLHNADGIIDDQIEQLVKIQGNFSLFSGGRDMATYYGSLNAEKSIRNRATELRRIVEENVRNFWQNLRTANANAEFLRNQANIAGEFLDLARTERKLGNRPLIDILNVETSFINAISSSLAAETDTVLAFYDLLFSMGVLRIDVFSKPEERLGGG